VAIDAVVELINVAINVVYFAAGILVRPIAACIRLYRYAASPLYRQKVQADLQDRSRLYRVAYLWWGVVFMALLLLSIEAIAYGAAANPLEQPVASLTQTTP